MEEKANDASIPTGPAIIHSRRSGSGVAPSLGRRTSTAPTSTQTTSGIASEKGRASDSVSFPAEASESGNSTDHLNSGVRAQSRVAFPSPFRLVILRVCPNPAAHVFNLLHLGRELIAEPSKVLDSGQFEYRIGQSVAALCKVAKIRSVHRLPRYSSCPATRSKGLYSNLDCVMASSRHCRAGNGNSDSDWKSGSV